MRLVCNKCGVAADATTDEVALFYVKHKNKTPVRRSDWCSYCVSCTKEIKRDFYKRNASSLLLQSKKKRSKNHNHYLAVEAARRLKKTKSPEAILRRRAVQSLDQVARYVHDRALQWKRSAEKRSIRWALSEAEIAAILERQKGLCYYTKRPLVLSPNSPDTLSLDRLTTTNGYVTTNVVLCGARVNKMKLDMDPEDFKMELETILRNWSPHLEVAPPPLSSRT